MRAFCVHGQLDEDQMSNNVLLQIRALMSTRRGDLLPVPPLICTGTLITPQKGEQYDST